MALSPRRRSTASGHHQGHARGGALELVGLHRNAARRSPSTYALRRAGVPTITLYALRHTAATLLLEAGVPMKVAQERLGHSTMLLTADTYSHVSATLQERAVEELERYVGKP